MHINLDKYLITFYYIEYIFSRVTIVLIYN